MEGNSIRALCALICQRDSGISSESLAALAHAHSDHTFDFTAEREAVSGKHANAQSKST